MKTLHEHLSERCDDEDCTSTATHDGRSKTTGQRGKFCNTHTDWNAPAFARND